MSDQATRIRAQLLERALQPVGKASAADRRAAFANQQVPEAARALVDKVAHTAWEVTDEDVAAARARGVSEDQVFELVVCAALGQSSRQLEAALAVLDEATATPADPAASPTQRVGGGS
ncbi:MAG: hypothetical protein H0X17_21365 [Deltaproteobacteria bacterium]|nr:hypothetical protein [Deltaproteobacteria bacterium]